MGAPERVPRVIESSSAEMMESDRNALPAQVSRMRTTGRTKLKRWSRKFSATRLIRETTGPDRCACEHSKSTITARVSHRMIADSRIATRIVSRTTLRGSRIPPHGRTSHCRHRLRTRTRTQLTLRFDSDRCDESKSTCVIASTSAHSISPGD